MRRLFVISILALLALTAIFLQASAMSDYDKIRAAMAAERTLMNSSAIASARVNINGSNNDMNVTVKLAEGSEKSDTNQVASATVPIAVIYITLVNMYPDLGNLGIEYDNNTGMVLTGYGLRSWAEQVRKEGNGYNNQDLIDFGAAVMLTTTDL
jgi:hypothetical protein